MVKIILYNYNMEAHQSVADNYETLRKLNPTITEFKQNGYGIWFEKMSSDLGLKQSDYSDNKSLLFVGTINPRIKYEGDVPVSVVSSRILVAIGRKLDTNLPIAEAGGLAIMNFDEYHFYQNFFVREPKTIISIDCDPRWKTCDLDVYKTGVWCNRCYGDLFEGSASNLSAIMKKTIQFHEIPKDSIMYIEQIETPIDQNSTSALESAKEFMEQDTNRISDLEREIYNIRRSIQAFVSEQIESTYRNKEILQHLLLQYGGSKEALAKKILDFDKIILAVEQKKRVEHLENELVALGNKKVTLEEECTMLEQERKSMNTVYEKKIAELNAKIRDLTGFMQFSN